MGKKKSLETAAEVFDRTWRALRIQANDSTTNEDDLRNGDVVLSRSSDRKNSDIIVGVNYRVGLLKYADGALEYEEERKYFPTTDIGEFIKIGHINNWREADLHKETREILMKQYGKFSEDVIYDGDWEEDDLVVKSAEFLIALHFLSAVEVDIAWRVGFPDLFCRLRFF